MLNSSLIRTFVYTCPWRLTGLSGISGDGCSHMYTYQGLPLRLQRSSILVVWTPKVTTVSSLYLSMEGRGFVWRERKIFLIFLLLDIRRHGIDIRIKRRFGILMLTNSGAIHQNAWCSPSWPSVKFPWCFTLFEIRGISQRIWYNQNPDDHMGF